jgi:hypothetical protein
MHTTEIIICILLGIAVALALVNTVWLENFWIGPVVILLSALLIYLVAK